MDTARAPTTLNIPSVLAFAIISFLAIRYFFFSTPSTTTTTTTTTSSASASAASYSSARTVPANRVEQVVAMFPQLSRRDVEWDLLRNGGSVQATTERVLREGRLPGAPPNFRPSTPASTTPASSSSSSSTTTTTTAHKPTHPDLITRYNLLSRISPEAAAGAGEEAQGVKGRQAWSQSKGEREALLKRRREEMVLQARRRMEARERAGGVGKGKERAG